MKTFHGDFIKFLNDTINNVSFSLSRWGDGELSILEKKNIDLRDKGNGEFRYDKDMEEYQGVRDKLLESYTYKDDEYYIGVACSCCVGVEKYEYMKKLSGQDENQLTWANIFVNSNYPRFVDYFVPEFKNHTINLVVNNKANLDKLPFSYKNCWVVGTDAWLTDYDLVNEITNYIETNNVTKEIFLFAAGPFANILTYELWKVSNKNTYIDIGSVLDPYLGLELTRGYLMGAKTLNKTCIW